MIAGRLLRLLRAEWAARRAEQASPPSARPPTQASPPSSSPPDPLALHWARLELAPGSDDKAIRDAYRRLMKRYHPDRHGGTPEKAEAAHRVASALTESYEALLRVRRGRSA